jgi:chromate transporter
MLLARRPWAARAVAGINAAVVGVLAAALYDPVWREGVKSIADAIIVALGLTLVSVLKRSPIWAVLWCVAAAVAWRLLQGLIGP